MRGKNSHSRSPSMMQSVSWQYKQSKDEWKSFLPEANMAIDDAVAKGRSKLKFAAYGQTYVIDFKKMEVCVDGTRKRWPVRKTGGQDFLSDMVKDAFEVMQKEEKDTKPFMPPHHLVYKIQATTGYLAPILIPQSNLGVAGRLIVTAIRGRKLYDTQSMGHQDPYIRFSLEGMSKQKKAVYPIPRCQDGGQNPVWNHTVEIPISSEDQYLRMSIWNKRMVADSLIGRARLPLHEILPFVNPLIAYYHDHDKKGSSQYEKLFLTTSEYAAQCCKYSHRSWFQIVRDLKSTTQAGQLLLEFRFFPYRASKIIDWDAPGTRPGEIRRVGKVFGESLQTGVDSSEVHFPQPIFDCVEYLTKHGLDTEGIFRVPGDSNQMNEIKKGYDQRRPVYLKGVNEVSGVLKLYFRELPEPLIPYTHFKSLISVPGGSSSKEDLIEKFKVVIATMDVLTRHVLRYLCQFLKKITDRAEINKMRPKNLATCWAPSLMRSKNENDPANIRNIPMTIETTEKLIVHSDEIFGVEKLPTEPAALAMSQSSSIVSRLSIHSFDNKGGERGEKGEQYRSSLKPAVLNEIKEVGSPASVSSKFEKARQKRNRKPSNSSAARSMTATLDIPSIKEAGEYDAKDDAVISPLNQTDSLIVTNLPVTTPVGVESKSLPEARSRNRSRASGNIPVPFGPSPEALKNVKLKKSTKRRPPPPPKKKKDSMMS